MHQAGGADYGVLIEDKGIALRGLFVIDPEGTCDTKLSRSEHRSLGGRDAGVIQALQTGGLCQAEWKPGSKDQSVKAVISNQ